MRFFKPGMRIQFTYENYKGETALRDVVIRGLDYGSNDWYPEDQWFLHCWDPSKSADRSFALSKIDAREIKVLP